MNKRVYEKVQEELLEDMNLLVETVRSIISYNGALSNLDVFDMSMIDDLLQGKKPSEVLSMANTKKFDYDEDYFSFSGNGKLVSCNHEDFIEECKDNIDDIMDEVVNICHQYLPSDLVDIIDRIETEDEEEYDYIQEQLEEIFANDVTALIRTVQNIYCRTADFEDLINIYSRATEMEAYEATANQIPEIASQVMEIYKENPDGLPPSLHDLLLDISLRVDSEELVLQ